MTVTCEDFDSAADDLALGFAPSPRRDELVAHAAGCAPCAAHLAALTTVVDALLELAPSAEPPVGFEARAVAAMGAAAPAQRSPARRPARRLVIGGAVAAALAGVLAVGAALGRDGDGREARAADVTARTGSVLGRVELVATPTPKVLVLLEDDDWTGEWVCQLQDDDGSWVEVGRWTAAEASGGAWAAAIDHELLDATRMRITSAAGTVIATSSPLR